MWWATSDPPEDSRDAASGAQAAITRASSEISKREFHFEGSTQVELFKDSWTDRQVASRIKTLLAADFPTAPLLSGWKDPGLRVPVTAIRFERAPGGNQAYVKVEAAFLELRSEQPISLSDLSAGKPLLASFVYRREEALSQNAEMRFAMAFHYAAEEGTLETTSIKGSFKVTAPCFAHQNDFDLGPWTARPAPRFAER
jgi:hypothetical protein